MDSGRERGSSSFRFPLVGSVDGKVDVVDLGPVGVVVASAEVAENGLRKSSSTEVMVWVLADLLPVSEKMSSDVTREI